MTDRKIKTVSDIEEEARKRDRERFKRETTADVKDLFRGIFEPDKPEPPKKPEKPSNKWGFIKWIGIIGIIFLALIFITLTLGIVWLLKFLIKSLFGF